MSSTIEESVGLLEAAGSAPLDEKPVAPPVEGEAPPQTVGENFRLYALGALTAIVFALCLMVALPFMTAMTWAVAFAIIGMPAHRRLEALIGNPSIAAFLSTTVVAGVIIGMGLLVAYPLAEKAPEVAKSAGVAPASAATGDAGSVQEKNPARAREEAAADAEMRETLGRVPVISRIADWADRVGVNIRGQVQAAIANFTRDFSSIASNSAAFAVQFLAALFLLFFLYRDREEFKRGLRAFLPLTRSEADHIFTRASDSVYANLYATFVTSVIDGVGIGLMFWWLGLPDPLLWAVVMFILSLLPVVGAGLVWLPAAGYLAVHGQWVSGLILIAWSTMFFVLNDNFLYARLAGPRMQMHQAPALLAFFGGLAVFGISGMVLGPAIWALGMAFLEVWKHRLTGVDPAPAIISGDERPAIA
jgi:predicted PurR-regulated permease PerM